MKTSIDKFIKEICLKEGVEERESRLEGADQEVFQGASEDCVSSNTWIRDFEG